MLEAFVEKNLEHLKNVATGVRCLGMDAVLKAKSGHVGVPLGCADIGTLLYFGVMNYDPRQPEWLDRDRFVLSNGHGSMLQYALLHLAGFDLSIEDIVKFRQLGSRTPGHPERGHTKGVEVTTGPLGQGLANSVGLALAERMLGARFNSAGKPPVIDHLTYVIAGDGCLMEGVTSEASSVAGHLKLNKLICFYDDNHITIDGKTDISFSENVAMRYKAYGWNTLDADGNDFLSLAKALDKAHEFARQEPGHTGPTLIVCHGVPGFGSPKWAGNPKIHGNPMSDVDVEDAKRNLGVAGLKPFELTDAIRQSAKALLAARGAKAKDWEARLPKTIESWKSQDAPRLTLWEKMMNPNTGDFPADFQLSGKLSTRVAGGKCLAALAKDHPELVGGSADLAGSTLTTLADSPFVSASDFSGRNLHFGVREHGMGAIANGLAAHGGLRPYVSTFAVFSDYMRPTVRLAAIMKLPVIYIFTHDSYAVGEDGPTHQPIEHGAALRAIPDLEVLRPADAVETKAAWKRTVEHLGGPVALLLTRQDLQDLDALLEAQGQPRRRAETVADGMTDGAYLVRDFPQAPPTVVDEKAPVRFVTLIGAGSEVQIALEAARFLEERKLQDVTGASVSLKVRVVSAPAPQRLTKNPVAFNRLVPASVRTIAIEAGATQSWGEIVGRSGAIFGLDRFGESAPAEDIARHLGFTTQAFADFVLRVLGLRAN